MQTFQAIYLKYFCANRKSPAFIRLQGFELEKKCVGYCRANKQKPTYDGQSCLELANGWDAL